MLTMSIQPSQPQSIGGVLDTTFQLYKASLVKMIPMMLLTIVAISPVYIYYAYVFTQIQGNPNPAATLAAMGPTAGYWIAMGITWLASQLMVAASAVKMNAIGAGNDASVAQSLQAALPRLPSLLIASLLYPVVVVLSFFLLVVPCIILSVSLLLFVATCVFDGKGPIGSLTASHRLVWGNWWRTAAILTVGFILLIVLYLVVTLVVGVFAPFAGIAAGAENAIVFGVAIAIVIGLLLYLFVTPFYYALMLAIYWDLKLRKEGGDLAARVGALNPA